MVIPGCIQIIAYRVDGSRRDKGKRLFLGTILQKIHPVFQCIQLGSLAFQISLQSLNPFRKDIQGPIVRIFLKHILCALHDGQCFRGGFEIAEHHIGIPFFIGVLVIGVHMAQGMAVFVINDLAGDTICPGSDRNQSVFTDRNIICRSIAQVILMECHVAAVCEGKPPGPVLGWIQQVPTAYLIKFIPQGVV